MELAIDKLFIIGEGRTLLIVGQDYGFVTEVPVMDPQLRDKISLARDAAKEMPGVPSMVVLHYRKGGEDSEGGLGFVRTGDVRQGDRIVAVPGCFHHLVLRHVSRPDSKKRWRLVGLALLFTKLDKQQWLWGYTKAEWERLRQDRTLDWFAIL